MQHAEKILIRMKIPLFFAVFNKMGFQANLQKIL